MTIVIILCSIVIIARFVYSYDCYKKEKAKAYLNYLYKDKINKLNDEVLSKTKVITEVVLDCTKELKIDKNEELIDNKLIKLLDKIFKHKDIESKLPNFDCESTNNMKQVLKDFLVEIKEEKEKNMRCCPWTVAAALSRWYATELLWHEPSSSLTNKMVDQIEIYFDDLWKTD